MIRVGDIFGELEVMKITSGGGAGRHRRFECLCRACKKLTTMTTPVIRKSRSCGCQRRQSDKWKSRGPKKCPWQHPPGVAARNDLEATYRRGALRRGLSFTLTIEEFTKISTGPCRYCGRELTNVMKGQGKTSGDFLYTGIDRLDPLQGYTKENSVSCCWMCNNMKGIYSEIEFLEHIERIASHKRSK